MSKPTKDDAALLIQIFGIESADQEYQKAVNWILVDMNETNYEDYKAKNPIGSEGYKNFMKLCHYWELIATLVNHDVLNEDLVFDMHGDMLWDKAEPIVYGMRKDLDFPRFLENYEVCAKKYPKWAENNPLKV